MQEQGEERAAAETMPQESHLTHKLSAQEIRANVNLIQQAMKAVFKKDVHYGIIPGTQKPTLYKPGAEQIMTMFRLNGEPLIDDLSGADEIRYRVRVRITHQVTRLEIGWGVGECSSNETKYKWIAPVCDQEWDEMPEDRRREKWLKGRDGTPYKKKQIRPNLADAANTILKMAKKRALIDATLTCTAASDVFDQDIEDLPEALRQNVAEQTARAPMPQRASEKAQAPAPAAPPNNADEYEYDEPPAQRRMIDASSGRKMKAKFDAPCKLCGKKIIKDTDMVYIGEGVDKGAYHAHCANG